MSGRYAIAVGATLDVILDLSNYSDKQPAFGLYRALPVVNLSALYFQGYLAA